MGYITGQQDCMLTEDIMCNRFSNLYRSLLLRVKNRMSVKTSCFYIMNPFYCIMPADIYTNNQNMNYDNI